MHDTQCNEGDDTAQRQQCEGTGTDQQRFRIAKFHRKESSRESSRSLQGQACLQVVCHEVESCVTRYNSSIRQRISHVDYYASNITCHTMHSQGNARAGTCIHVFDGKRRPHHRREEAVSAHFEIYVAWGIRFAAPQRVCGHDALFDKIPDALAVQTMGFFVVRAVETRVPWQSVTIKPGGSTPQRTTWGRHMECSRRTRRVAWLGAHSNPSTRPLEVCRRI
jgi:hypothetical protein